MHEDARSAQHYHLHSSSCKTGKVSCRRTHYTQTNRKREESMGEKYCGQNSALHNKLKWNKLFIRPDLIRYI